MTPERWRQARAVFEHADELPAAERPAYLASACSGDPALLQEVESLLASQSQAGASFLDKPAVELLGPTDLEPDTAARIGSRIGPYEIIALLGRGGMGEVYRARRVDGHYDAEVAVKLVRTGLDTAVIAERLRHERQILAGLEHPNIARLLDGGTTSVGAPYLVMELVEGLPIDEFCNARRLSITERLRLFRRVCEAVQYAHRRLVIHRDLKPSNILVPPDGQPKLLDFGIARLLDPAAGATVTLLQALTPEYASPEQFKGEPITTATDVYSLGVVLYRLLSGGSPYPSASSTPHALVRAVCDLNPPAPSTAATTAGHRTTQVPADGVSQPLIRSAEEATAAKLRRRLAGDLDHIILKAMSKDPDDRYGTVEQLADDIDRHLQGRPVKATRGSWAYRAAKFARRRKGPLAASFIVLLSLSAGLASTLHQARIATANGRRAEQRFNDVRHLATSFLFEFHDAIHNLPGSTPARALLVKRALEYLDSLSREAAADAALRRELATAYATLADIQGAPMRNSLGDLDGALTSIAKAVSILEVLHRDSPRDETLSSELAHAYGEMANLLDAKGSFAAAVDLYRKGLAIIAAIPRPGLATLRVMGTLQVSYGDALAKNGNLKAAVDAYRKAIELDGAVVRGAPQAHAFARDQGVAYIHLASGFDDMGMVDDALASARSAYGLFQSLAGPDDAQSRRDLAVANVMIAEQLAKRGDKRGALAVQQQELAADLQVAAGDPQNHLARRDVYVDYYKIAGLQSDLNQMREAIANERRVIELTQTEDKLTPGNAVTRADLQTGYFHLSQMLAKTGDYAGALDNALKAREISKAAVTANPADLAGRSDLSEVEMAVSDAQLALGRRREAVAGYLDATARSESIVAGDPNDVGRRIVLARLYAKLGGLIGLSRPAEPASTGDDNARRSRDYYRRSLAIWADLERKKQLGADSIGESARIARLLKGASQAPAPRRP